MVTMANKAARNVTVAAHEGIGNERTGSRNAPAPPNKRARVTAAATADRTADSRMRNDRRRRAVA